MDFKDNTEKPFSLEGLPKQNPFKTPSDYFSNLSEDLFLEQSLKSKISKTGFVNPKNYFENFEVKPKSNLVKLIPYISVAASIVFCFFTYTYIQSNNKTTEYIAMDLNQEEIVEYLYNEQELHLEDLLSYSNELEIDLIND